MSKSAAIASLGLVACGSWQAGRAFVTAAQGPVGKVGGSALRGVARPEADVAGAAEQSSAAPLRLVGASGALAIVAMGHSKARSRGSALRQAAGAAAPTEPAKEAAMPETPPPPPPFDPATQRGVTAPLGFFDPLGFTKVGDEAGFRKLRSAEIKHGRVAMMAAVGAVIQHFVQLPGFESIPKGLGAATSSPGTYGLVALFLVSGLLELLLWTDKDEKEVGDYGNPLSLGMPLGWSDDMRDRELNNGRAAMFAAMGIIAAELATGKDAVEQLI